MAPEATSTGVPWELLAVVMASFFGIIGWTMRWLYRTIFKRVDEKANYAQQNIDKLETRLKEALIAHERLRDKWDNFLTEYLKIDSTRAQKVDALFRVLDAMQKNVESISRNMDQQLEDAFARAMSELKLYVQEQQTREKTNG